MSSIASDLSLVPDINIAGQIMPLALYILTAGAFGIGITEFIIGLLLEVSADFGVSIAVAGLLISGCALGVVAGAPVLSALSHGTFGVGSVVATGLVSEDCKTSAIAVMFTGLNGWIRENRAFDVIVDFEAALPDPAHPARLRPAFDSGDHLHPGDKGNQAMAEAIDLKALLGR